MAGLVWGVHDGFTHTSCILEGIVRRVGSPGTVDERAGPSPFTHRGPRVVRLFLWQPRVPERMF